ncbi:MAG: response regulator [Candidatus Omnitrophota bacterium]
MKKKKILIIDDDDGMRSAIRRFLAAEGKYEIDEVSDGSMVEEKIKQFSPQLLLLDIRMPEKDGYEVCLSIRRNASLNNIKIIAMSGLAGNIGDAIIRALGADCFFEKPFDNEKLKAKIAELLGDE